MIASFLFATVLSANAADIVVSNDNGGVIGHYMAKYDTADRVIIDGWCASACTLALGLRNVCVTDRARLGFHAASGTEGTDLLMSTYPGAVQAWINRHGGLTKRLLILEGRKLTAFLKRCH